MKKMKRKPLPLLLGRYDFVFPDERGATAGHNTSMAKFIEDDVTGIHYGKHFFKRKNRRQT